MCSLCGKKIHVIVYSNKKYRGGHFFGRMPMYHKTEMRKAMKSGTRSVTIHGLMMKVFKVEPKPYTKTEYWECPKCYWRY